MYFTLWFSEAVSNSKSSSVEQEGPSQIAGTNLSNSEAANSSLAPSPNPVLKNEGLRTEPTGFTGTETKQEEAGSHIDCARRRQGGQLPFVIYNLQISTSIEKVTFFIQIILRSFFFS